MTTLSHREMRNACHALAAQIMHTSARTNRCKWLREAVFELLKDEDFIDTTARKYAREYPYADAPTEYLAEVMKAYDEEAE